MQAQNHLAFHYAAEWFLPKNFVCPVYYTAGSHLHNAWTTHSGNERSDVTYTGVHNS